MYCTHTNLLKPLEVLPEEGHGPVRPGGAQLDNAVLQQLLNVVFLHVLLALPQAPLLLTARTSRCHDDNHDPALWPLTFVLERMDSNEEQGHDFQITARTAWAHWITREQHRVGVSVCHHEKWTNRKRENVRKIEPEWEGTGRWGVVLAPMSLRASQCQEWELVIWCDHKYLTTNNKLRKTHCISCLGLFTQNNATFSPAWKKPSIWEAVSYTRPNFRQMLKWRPLNQSTVKKKNP